MVGVTANTTTTTNNDALADFALLIFERARQLQHERTGLMSNRDARNRACMEHFTKAITDIQNVIGYIRLFGGDSKDEQLKSMLDQTMGAFGSGTSKLLKNFEIEEIQQTQGDSKEPIQTKIVRETEIVVP